MIRDFFFMVFLIFLKHKNVGRERAQTVNENIKRIAVPAENESLMPFVGSGENQDKEKTKNQMPVEGPNLTALKCPILENH